MSLDNIEALNAEITNLYRCISGMRSLVPAFIEENVPLLDYINHMETYILQVEVLSKAGQNSIPAGMSLVNTERYNRICKDSDDLLCLMAAGVDNWSGYDLATELMNE